MPRCQSTPNTKLLQVPPTDVSSVKQLYYCVKLLQVPTNYTTTLSYNHACQRAHSIPTHHKHRPAAERSWRTVSGGDVSQALDDGRLAAAVLAQDEGQRRRSLVVNEVDLLRTRVVFVGRKAPEALDLKLLDSCHREKSNDSLPFSRNLETSSRSIKSSMRKRKKIHMFMN